MTDTTETKPQSFRGRIKAMAKGPLFYPISVFVGFLEGSFVVVPMEPVFIPMMVMKRKQAWLVALALLLGNVLGGLLIYWLGALLADDVIQPLISMFDAQQSYDETVRKLKEEGFTTLFMIGVTPFPFQVGVAAAGAAGFSVALFVIAVAASRSIRFLVIAFLVMLVGQRAEDVLRKYDVEILIGGLLIFAGFATYLVFFA
ncbi:MAG: alkaline phosphatase [Hyphomonadaceae bacterium]|nr:alkaline phosphatase [Hyphomonadaceae bacterium]